MIIARKNKRNLAAMIMLLLTIMFGSSIPASHASTKYGVEVSSDTVTRFYMSLSLASVGDMAVVSTSFKMPLKAFKRTKADMTMLIIFRDIKYENQFIFVSKVVKFSFPSVWGFRIKVAPESHSVEIDIRTSFYNYLKLYTGTNTTQTVNIVLLNNGQSTDMCVAGKMTRKLEFKVNDINFYEKEKPGGVDNPDSPDFELGDGSGSSTDTKTGDAIDFFKRIVLAFKNVFTGKGNFWEWLIVVLTIISVIAIIGVLRWAYKKLFR